MIVFLRQLWTSTVDFAGDRFNAGRVQELEFVFWSMFCWVFSFLNRRTIGTGSLSGIGEVIREVIGTKTCLFILI